MREVNALAAASHSKTWIEKDRLVSSMSASFASEWKGTGERGSVSGKIMEQCPFNNSRDNRLLGITQRGTWCPLDATNPNKQLRTFGRQ
jgi:hypothetical protein